MRFQYSLPCHSCEGMCEGMESMEGSAKGNSLNMTASTGIDPLPLPTSQPGDDIPVEACHPKASCFSKKSTTFAANLRPMASASNKKKIFNDPIYGFVSIPDELHFDIIEHPYFQRLRRIKQVSMTNLVYPGANHTRFAHSLGAMHFDEARHTATARQGLRD